MQQKTEAWGQQNDAGLFRKVFVGMQVKSCGL